MSRLLKTVGGGRKLSLRDKLMLVHTVIYICFFACITTINTIELIENRRGVEDATVLFTCRTTLALDIVYGVTVGTNYSLMLLFAYMSVKFSEPVPDAVTYFVQNVARMHTFSRNSGMLGSSETVNELAASRYLQASIRDANLRILNAIASQDKSHASDE